MKIKLPLIALALIVLCSVSVYAQQQDKHTFRIALNVSADDEIKSDVISYVSRELRSLVDVEIVGEDSEPRYLVSIVAMTSTSTSGREFGYALSLTVERYTSKERADSLIPKCLPKDSIFRTLLDFELTTNTKTMHHNLIL
ncbi:MAG: hypothetical protein L0220_34370 [Acidobacteria bacterium]|nr:hypothetical protein [Acidobacteriota bacterium]